MGSPTQTKPKAVCGGESGDTRRFYAASGICATALSNAYLLYYILIEQSFKELSGKPEKMSARKFWGENGCKGRTFFLYKQIFSQKNTFFVEIARFVPH